MGPDTEPAVAERRWYSSFWREDRRHQLEGAIRPYEGFYLLSK